MLPTLDYYRLPGPSTVLGSLQTVFSTQKFLAGE